MKLEIARLANEGSVKLEEDLNADKFDLDFPHIKFSDLIKISGLAERKNDVVIVNAEISAPLVIECSRCLKEFSYSLNDKITLDYPVGANDTMIDIGDDLRSEIVLNFPVISLCRQDCKGLCVGCGEDLNEGRCKCEVA